MAVRLAPRRRGARIGLSVRFPRPARAPLAAGVLPLELSGFVGREDETLALTQSLRDGPGLVTLTGLGGVGKTRLALHTAALVQSTYPCGARLVSLAQLPGGRDVASYLLAALGLRERPHVTATEALIQALAVAPMLLVLDNCEHVIQDAALLVDALLRACRGLQILATSRESLGVPGERIVRVLPLPLPADDEPFATLIQNDAVVLFAERARSAEPGFRLTPTVGQTVAEICRLLDGMPLALELAAARTPAMSVAEIASRLTDPLTLLTTAPRTAPARHQTLRATLDWSYSLLTPDEQRLFRRLAVFTGGFSVEAAARVCSEPEIPPANVLDLLDRLVAKSLVFVVAGQAPTRFALLETLRGYALQRVQEAGEESAIRERHREWCLGLVVAPPADAFAPGQMLQLRHEQHNLLAALRWTSEAGQSDAACQLATGLAPYWLQHGPYAEGRALLLMVAERPSAPSSALHAGRAIGWAAVLAQNEGDHALTEVLARRAFSLAESADDEVGMSIARCAAGLALLGQGELQRAAAEFEAGLTLAGAGLPLAEVHAGRLSEILLELGEDGRAEELLDRAAGWSQTTGFPLTRGRILVTSALAAERRRECARADALLAEGLAVERELGGMPGLIEVLTMTGNLLADRGERLPAANALNEALDSAAAHGTLDRLARVLEAICGLVVLEHPDACLRLAAAADELRASLRALPRPSERRRLAQHLRTARRRLGEAAYASIWRLAQTTPLDAIVAEASTVLRDIGAAPVPLVAAGLPDALSGREREVVFLVMRGLSNREIADELVVSRKTAEAHISHILTKLGLVNRVQIAAWAYERGWVPPETVVPAVTDA